MKIRADINAVSEGPDGGYALLAAFLEATDKIDRRALQKRDALSDAPKAVNLEAQPTLLEAHPALLDTSPASVEASPTLLEASPTSTAPKSHVAPFAFRRANLVRA